MDVNSCSKVSDNQQYRTPEYPSCHLLSTRLFSRVPGPLAAPISSCRLALCTVSQFVATFQRYSSRLERTVCHGCVCCSVGLFRYSPSWQLHLDKQELCLVIVWSLFHFCIEHSKLTTIATSFEYDFYLRHDFVDRYPLDEYPMEQGLEGPRHRPENTCLSRSPAAIPFILYVSL